MIPAEAWIPHAWGVGIISVLALFGGPEMMSEAEWAERAGLPRSAKALRVGAWASLALTPVAFRLLWLGWI